MSIRCPKCGAELVLISADLSDAARAILERGPERFLRGDEMPISAIAAHIGYEYTATQNALVELAGAKRVHRRRVGIRKHRYSLIIPNHSEPR